MKLVIEYDPWDDTGKASRAAEAFETLGFPVELRVVKPFSNKQKTSPNGPVVFEKSEADGHNR